MKIRVLSPIAFRYSWAAAFLFILFGFLPYKIPVLHPAFDKPNRLLVRYQDCTGCGEFEILNGHLLIPPRFDSILKDTSEVNETGPGSPFQCMNKNQAFDLVVHSNLILEGKVVGVDKQGGGMNAEIPNLALFEVSKWEMTSYYPRVLTFPVVGMLVYLLTLLIGLMILLSYTIVSVWKRNTKPNDGTP